MEHHEHDNDLPTSPLPFITVNNQHRTYLVTYSYVDMNKFPTSRDFPRVVGAFGGENVDYYVSGRELWGATYLIDQYDGDQLHKN